MNKTLKKNILDSIQTMYEAHGFIEELYNERNDTELEEILANCQEMAISIGNTIEKSEAGLKEVVEPLEKYCEELYQISVNYKSNMKASKIRKKLDKSLIAAENRVKNDIIVRVQVVFMPYKASMWDSLESIWKAANEDEECEAFVVPIPYYDRNPDFSLGKYNYEGDLFPEYVPIMDYKLFDLETRKPDVIYIHNPYDDCNYVTSVDPKFYSWELKKHTECLVYVPYCVYQEQENIYDERIVEWYSKYALLPIMKNADKIILQSEKFRELFINISLLNLGGNKKYWEDKICGLGSPKFDKTLSLDSSKNDYPDIWNRFLEKEDYKKKTIVFYNTSLNSFLEYKEKILEKIENILIFFRENKDKYILLWRPHPLVESTLKAMNPSMYSKYKILVNKYKEENYGIYDNSPEYTHAVKISDLYYGDYSSLVSLYQKTKKTVLIQNPEILNYDLHLVSEKIYVYKKKVWLVSRDFNGLFSWDINSGQFRFLGSFRDEELEGYQLYYGMVGVEDRLYFCPYNAKNIGVYDINKQEFSYIELEKDIIEEKKKFIGIVNIGEEIFLMGRSLPFSIKVSILTNKVDKINNLSKDIHCVKNGNSYYYLSSICASENKIYYFHADSRSIFIYDPEENTNDTVYRDDKLSNRTFIEKVNSKIWIFEKPSGKISMLDTVLNFRMEVCVIDKLSCFCTYNKYIYCFSFKHSIMYKIDTETKEVKEIKIGITVYDSYVIEDKIYLLDYLKGNFYIFDIQKEQLHKVELRLNTDILSKLNLSEIFQNNRENNSNVLETSFFNISYLLEQGLEKNVSCINEHHKNYGNMIYQYVKGVAKNENRNN